MRSSALWTAALCLLALLWGDLSSATPLYTARAGRTCDNCHELPNTWYDPPEAWARKCTLSCASCHVDPSGGALRNASGRYFARTTLPMFWATERPLDDRDLDELRDFLDQNGRPTSEPASGSYQPAAAAEAPAVAATGGPAWGRPLLGGRSPMAWLDGRYGDLNADPLLQLGGDLRLAWWSPGSLVFPMQADLHAAVHPVEHLTVAATVGARGRVNGFGEVAQQELPIEARDLWVMTHEWPALSYARAGRFLPAFGWRTEDHTSPTRRAFGLSQEDPANRVLGAEIGFTGNYPYASASVFTPVDPNHGGNPFATGEGWGAALSGGWRHMGWSLGGSAMIRQRPLAWGGDTLDGSVQWSVNPWYYWKNIPITWLGEVAVGRLQRPFSGNETTQVATSQTLAWRVTPGVNLQLRYDLWEPDREVSDDAFHRPGLSAEWVVLPGLALRGDLRVGVTERAGVGDPPATSSSTSTAGFKERRDEKKSHAYNVAPVGLAGWLRGGGAAGGGGSGGGARDADLGRARGGDRGVPLRVVPLGGGAGDDGGDQLRHLRGRPRRLAGLRGDGL
jgi:hypothetical protein